MYVNGRICFGSATLMCMGDHKSLEAGGALVLRRPKKVHFCTGVSANFD